MRPHLADRRITPHCIPPRCSHNYCRAKSPIRLCDLVRLRRAEAAAALAAERVGALWMTDRSAIRRAIEKGVPFLESAQLSSGEIPIEISATAEMNGDRSRQPCVFPAALAARVLSITPAADRVRARAL